MFPAADTAKVDTMLKQSFAARNTPVTFRSPAQAEPGRTGRRTGQYQGHAFHDKTRTYAGRTAAWSLVCAGTPRWFFPFTGTTGTKNMETCSRMLKNSTLHLAGEVIFPGGVHEDVIRRQVDAANSAVFELTRKMSMKACLHVRFATIPTGEASQ